MDPNTDQNHNPMMPSLQNLKLLSFPIFIKRELTSALSLLLLIFLFLLSFFLLFNIIYPFSLLRIDQFSKIPNTSKTCDYSYGRWVRDNNIDDETYGTSRYYDEDCPFLDRGFQCRLNGRKDDRYLRWRWKPQGCDLPRFNASDLLERSQNGRIVFVGDSIGRNQWESLVCMLAQAVSNQTSKIYEENGNPITKHKGYLSMRFHDYNLTVEYYRVPFLVIIDHPPKNSSSQVRSAIRIDKLHWGSKKWEGANVLVFNAGHWWNQDKTIKMGFYFQEGEAINMTMNVMEAFWRSLQTWKSWAVQNLDPTNTYIFFRSYSPVHFRDGKWNQGGRCDNSVAPESNYKKLEVEPWNNLLIHKTIKQMKDAYKNVEFLNITYLTEFRKDGHPSVHREPSMSVPFVQDCSHWCLPGVPDTWNELLYANLLLKGYTTKNTYCRN